MRLALFGHLRAWGRMSMMALMANLGIGMTGVVGTDTIDTKVESKKANEDGWGSGKFDLKVPKRRQGKGRFDVMGHVE